MGFKVSVIEVREVLRGWLEGVGLRIVAERAGVDRKTARRYVAAAQEAGLERSASWAAVDDALVGAAVRPAPPGGHGSSWELLLMYEEAIRAWGGRDGRLSSIVKIDHCSRGRCRGASYPHVAPGSPPDAATGRWMSYPQIPERPGQPPRLRDGLKIKTTRRILEGSQDDDRFTLVHSGD